MTTRKKATAKKKPPEPTQDAADAPTQDTPEPTPEPTAEPTPELVTREEWDRQNAVNIGAASLARKMSLVMGDCKRLGKTGFNQHHRYAFTTAADVSDMIRELMAKHGLAFIPKMQQDRVDWTPMGKQQCCRIWFTMTFICSDTGHVLEIPWLGEAADTGDKGINKASTSATKYFLMKVFQVSTGDEPDADQESPSINDRRNQQKPPPALDKGQIEKMKKLVEAIDRDWDEFVDWAQNQMNGVAIESWTKQDGLRWIKWLNNVAEKATPAPKEDPVANFKIGLDVAETEEELDALVGLTKGMSPEQTAEARQLLKAKRQALEAQRKKESADTRAPAGDYDEPPPSSDDDGQPGFGFGS